MENERCRIKESILSAKITSEYEHQGGDREMTIKKAAGRKKQGQGGSPDEECRNKRHDSTDCKQISVSVGKWGTCKNSPPTVASGPPVGERQVQVITKKREKGEKKMGFPVQPGVGEERK